MGTLNKLRLKLGFRTIVQISSFPRGRSYDFVEVIYIHTSVSSDFSPWKVPYLFD